MQVYDTIRVNVCKELALSHAKQRLVAIPHTAAKSRLEHYTPTVRLATYST
jgi:hypothetical protein